MFNIDHTLRIHELERRNNEQKLANALSNALSKARQKNHENTLNNCIGITAALMTYHTQAYILSAFKD